MLDWTFSFNSFLSEQRSLLLFLRASIRPISLLLYIRVLILCIIYLWWLARVYIILVRLRYSLESALEIAAAKVYETMHMNMQ
jgi:hypothetical protein